MNPMWRCLNCSAPLEDVDSFCSSASCVGDSTIEKQSVGPSLWDLALGLDLDALAEDDEYRRSKGLERYQTAQDGLRAKQDAAMRWHAINKS